MHEPPVPHHIQWHVKGCSPNHKNDTVALKKIQGQIIKLMLFIEALLCEEQMTRLGQKCPQVAHLVAFQQHSSLFILHFLN